MATNKNVTIPQILPMMSVLLILNIGGIFRADFGLFYIVPRNSGALYNVTSVLDTYIYNGLTATGDVGMTAARVISICRWGMFVINCEFSCSSN